MLALKEDKNMKKLIVASCTVAGMLGLGSL
jgi:hypothetical protein